MIVDQDFFREIERKVLYEDKSLDSIDLMQLRNMVQELYKEIDMNHEQLLKLGKLLDYNDLKEKGFSSDNVMQFYIDDQKVIDNAKEVLEKHKKIDHSQMFGYPANMVEDSYVTSYLRWIESQMFFMNNCGDAYSPGNYCMHSFDSELKILEEISNNLRLPKNSYKGYINSGGTEGIFWGIREGVTKSNNPIVYYSDNAHYSVKKYITTIQKVDNCMISTENGRINVEELLEKIEKNYKENNKEAVIVLTGGTTALGSCDDVTKIKNDLKNKNIPCYIHYDAALYGGIPKNQKDSPMIDLGDLDLDSISVSLHKYLGNTQVNGILLSKTRVNANKVDYIGQDDYTFLGSRSILPFSTLQRIVEINHRSPVDDYIRNVNFFSNLLEDAGIEYIKGEKKGNIFIIDKPSDEICKKYQLATFKYLEKEKSHIIIFPYHKEEDMINLVHELKNEKILTKRKVK